MAKVCVKSIGEILDFAPGSYVMVHCPDLNEDIEFPIEDVEIFPDDISNIRNHFAAMALPTLLEHGNNPDEWVARRAFEIADAMMKQMIKE
jgi:hypothetical protein